MDAQKIIIAGIGPGSIRCVTPEVSEKIENAEIFAAAAHIHDMFLLCKAIRVVVSYPYEPLWNTIDENRHKNTVIAVSGDPGVSSFATLVLHRYGKENCVVFPGISSLQYAFARCYADWTQSYIVNAHARTVKNDYHLAMEFDTIGVLANDRNGLEWIKEFLTVTPKCYSVTLCENLTLPDERIRELTDINRTDISMSSRSILVLKHRKENL